MRAVRVFTAISAFGLLFQMIATPAHAGSCTQQGAECAAWAVGQYASYKGKCAKEIGACKARCSQGNKVFIGVLVGNSYPVDSCK
jgi:hypothetical protein